MQGRIWPWLGAVSGVLYVVLLMGSTSTGSDARIVIALELIAILLFLPFLGYLYSILRRAEGDGAWLSATAFGRSPRPPAWSTACSSMRSLGRRSCSYCSG